MLNNFPFFLRLQCTFFSLFGLWHSSKKVYSQHFRITGTVTNWDLGKYGNSVIHGVIIILLVLHRGHLPRVACYLFTEEQLLTHKYLLPFGMLEVTLNIHVELSPDTYAIARGQTRYPGS